MGDWQSIASCPKDGTKFLAYFDHAADPYTMPDGKLTDYAAWAEGGDFLDGAGFCIAVWEPADLEPVDEYGSGYWLPAYTFAFENDDCCRVVNATHWQPLVRPEKL